MDRRTFLKSTSAAAAATAAATSVVAREMPPEAGHETPPAAPAIHAGLRRMTVATAPQMRIGEGAHAALQRLGRALALVTEGRIGLDIIEPSSDTHDRAGPDRVQRGEVDAYWDMEGDDLARTPALLAFTGLPAVLDDTPDVYRAWLETGGGQDLWDDIAAGLGIKPLLAGQIETIIWAAQQPIDLGPVLAHMRRSARGFDRVLAETNANVADRDRAGADISQLSVTPYAPSAIMTTLASSSKASFATAYAGWSSPLNLTLGIRRALWDDLAAGERMLIEALVAAERTRLEAMRLAEHVAVREILSAHDIPLMSGPPPSLRLAWRDAADAARKETMLNNADAQRTLASYLAFKDLDDWSRAASV